MKEFVRILSKVRANTDKSYEKVYFIDDGRQHAAIIKPLTGPRQLR